MVERGLFQAADLGLADADFLCHLRLGLAVQIAQGNDAALPRCECLTVSRNIMSLIQLSSPVASRSWSRRAKLSSPSE